MAGSWDPPGPSLRVGPEVLRHPLPRRTGNEHRAHDIPNPRCGVDRRARNSCSEAALGRARPDRTRNGRVAHVHIPRRPVRTRALRRRRTSPSPSHGGTPCAPTETSALSGTRSGGGRLCRRHRAGWALGHRFGGDV